MSRIKSKRGLASDDTAIATVPSELDEMVGSIVAERYRVEQVLGQGGMGAVLRCHHLGLRRDVALKVLHSEFSRSTEIAARFAREAQSCSRLEHPNCVQVFDFGTWKREDRPTIQYLAMQLLEGSDLGTLLGEPMPLSRAVDFTIQILRGLEHAHAQGVIHRDLKPENVFVTYDHDGRELLKLVDFGLAKLVSGEGADDGMTRAGMVFGTPRYMSPEQGAGGQIDERTDVYATGVILYEMLSGRTPFDSDDVVDLIRQHITAPVPPLPEHIPASLRDVVERMLAKSRDVRYPDAASARAALELVRPQLVERVQVPEVRSATMARGSMFLSLSDVVRTSLPRLQQAASGRRRWMYGAAAGLAGLLFVVWIAGDDDDTAKKGGTAVAQPKKEASWIDRVVGTPKVSDEELAAVDTLIEKKALDEALTQIRNLLDQYPEDWKLRVRKARALVRQGKLAEALDAWGEAIDHGSIEILEDEALAAELTLLLEEDKVREPALTLAIRKLGAKGTPFLVSLLNRDADVLSYSDRHRALAALEQHGGSTELNVPLNRALDLWQAGDAKQPCTAFADGLAAIDDEPDPYYLGTLHAVTPPKSDANSPDPTCDSLPNDLQTVRNNLLKRYPDVPKSQWAVPKAYKKRRRRRGLFRRLFN